MKKFGLIALVLVAAAVTAQAASTATFTVTTSGTTWNLWVAVDGNSNGLSSFTCDLDGTGTTQVLTSTFQAPACVAPPLYAPVGFQSFPSGGVITVVGSNSDALGIQGGQATAYGDTNSATADAKIIQGIGQTAGSVAGGLGGVSSWAKPCLLASGTFSGAGTFTIANLAGSVLSKVSGGAWVGPGNVEAFVLTPEPATMSLLVIGGIGALLRRRAA